MQRTVPYIKVSNFLKLIGKIGLIRTFLSSQRLWLLANIVFKDRFFVLLPPNLPSFLSIKNELENWQNICFRILWLDSDWCEMIFKKMLFLISPYGHIWMLNLIVCNYFCGPVSLWFHQVIQGHPNKVSRKEPRTIVTAPVTVQLNSVVTSIVILYWLSSSTSNRQGGLHFILLFFGHHPHSQPLEDNMTL